jgi:hypothetical protein
MFGGYSNNGQASYCVYNLINEKLLAGNENNL